VLTSLPEVGSPLEHSDVAPGTFLARQGDAWTGLPYLVLRGRLDATRQRVAGDTSFQVTARGRLRLCVHLALLGAAAGLVVLGCRDRRRWAALLPLALGLAILVSGAVAFAPRHVQEPLAAGFRDGMEVARLAGARTKSPHAAPHGARLVDPPARLPAGAVVPLFAMALPLAALFVALARSVPEPAVIVTARL
jgi:hypothetical protein